MCLRKCYIFEGIINESPLYLVPNPVDGFTVVYFSFYKSKIKETIKFRNSPLDVNEF